MRRVRTSGSMLCILPLVLLVVHAHYLEFPVATLPLDGRVQDEAAAKGKRSKPTERHSHDRGRKPGHQARMLKLHDDGNAYAKPNHKEHEGEDGEEGQRLVVLEEREDHLEDLHSIAHGVELGL